MSMPLTEKTRQGQNILVDILKLGVIEERAPGPHGRVGLAITDDFAELLMRKFLNRVA